MQDIPTALTEALSSQYRFVREIGAGGMAVVYLARDLKHDRDVAIKVLKSEVAAAVGVKRFLSEIRTTGQLKHPHILPLFDSGSAGSLLFFVMPFIDGESLGARVRREGKLPIEEIVHILKQVTDALAYAHSVGVIHRDLKPDNILLSGRHVYLADFGIARLEATGTSAPTLTGSGVMAGTPSYMAPEQIVGGAIDHRSDIYALGALAYELLAGTPPFNGTQQEVIAAQLTRVPEPVTRYRPETPPALATLVMRCLQKQQNDRWQQADDVQGALEGMQKTGPQTAVRERSVLTPLLLASGAVFLVAVAVWYAMVSQKTSTSLSVGRIAHLTFEPGLELDPAISPDGRTIAYAAGTPGRMRIYLRQLAGSQIVPLLGEEFKEAHRWPQWSPDGTRIVFHTARPRQLRIGDGTIFEAPALGGTARQLMEAVPGNMAMTPGFSPDGTQLVFARLDGIYMAGRQGAPRRILAEKEAHSFQWSPDGKMIAYVQGGYLFSFAEEMLGNTETSTVRALIPETGQTKQLTNSSGINANPVWLPDSRTLLFISNQAGSRDIYSMRLSADGDPVGDPQRLTSGVNAHGITVSSDGKLLAYSSYTPSSNIWSVEIPETGSVPAAEARQITFGNEKIEKLAVSPDGQWLAYDSDRNGVADIWKVPAAGGTPVQLTRGPNHKFANGWSPDGREVLFHSIVEGRQRDVFVVSADGMKTETVASSPLDEQHSAWGPDGNSVVFDITPPAGQDRWQAFIVTRERRGAPWGTPRQLTKNGSADPKWSPDGLWIAFNANGELRLIAPDGTGERTLLKWAAPDPEPSFPIWSQDSQTIYYKAYDENRNSAIWSIPVTGGSPRLLVRFDDPDRRSLRREFATDGRRLYFTIARDESDIWTMELLKK